MQVVRRLGWAFVLALFVSTVVLLLSPAGAFAAPPVVNSLTPLPGASGLIGSGRTVAITASDTVALSSASSMRIDGMSVPAAWTYVSTGGRWIWDDWDETYYWEADYDTTQGTFGWTGFLRTGTHTVTATLVDASGASTPVSWSFTVGNAPAISSLRPSDGAYVTTLSPVVSCFVSDVFGTLGSVRMYDNGLAVPSSMSQGTFSAAGLRLADDTMHTISVTAADVSGVSSTATWRFFVHTAAPSVIPSSATLTSLAPTATATVSDLIPISSTISSASIDGLPARTEFGYDGADTTHARVGLAVGRLANGTHTAHLTVANAAGTLRTTDWTFAVSAPPAIVSQMPAPGGVVQTATPTISVVTTDNAGGAVEGTIAVDGVELPTSHDAAAHAFLATVVSPLANETTHTATIRITDAAGLSTTSSWSFKVRTGPTLPNSSCTVCHTTFPVAHPMSNCAACHGQSAPITNCPACHGPAPHASDEIARYECTYCHSAAYPSVPEHAADLDAAHASATDVTNCRPCHTSSLTVEHAARTTRDGSPIRCETCHESTDPDVAAAIATGNTACATCHTTVSGTGHQSVHETSAGVVTLAGTTNTCGDCHSANLMTEHVTNRALTCETCHPSPRNTISAFDPASCVQGGCHTPSSTAPMHGGSPAAHVLPSPVPTCVSSGCHPGGDLPAIHSAASTTTPDGTLSGCLVCHKNGSVPSSGDCASCHDLGSPHGDLTQAHTAVTTSTEIGILGTAYGRHECSECHASADVREAHGNDCAKCHPAPVNTMSSWDKTCVAAGCHAQGSTTAPPMHGDIDAKHTVGPQTCTQTGCHAGAGSLAAIHSTATTTVAGEALTSCAVCHASGRTPSAVCSDCHDTSSPHGDVAALHAGSPSPARITILGTDYGTHDCVECHPSLVLTTVHGDRCQTCHPSPRDSFAEWDATCVQGGCHTSSSSAPMHASIDAAHSTGDQPCTASGCHPGAGSVAAIHSTASTTTPEGVRSGCQVCHAAGVTPSTTCSDCHDTASPHAALAPLHTAAPRSGFEAMDLSDIDHEPSYGLTVDCTLCHETNLMSLHGNACDACHSSTDPAVASAIQAGRTDCDSCHPTRHLYKSYGHEERSYQYGNCGCHGAGWQVQQENCLTCHTDTVPPVTTSDVRSVYTGTATVRLTPTDNAGGSGIATTYYRIDGGAASSGTTATTSTVGPHSIEFWSVDRLGNRELHHVRGFRVVPVSDTTPPVTTSDAVASYTSSATIHFTADDGAGGAGVRYTRYALDGGPVLTGDSLSVFAGGSHSLDFWSVDWSGNAEAHHTVTFNVSPDTQPPLTTSDAAASYAGTATVHLFADDGASGSGIAATYYSLDGYAAQSGTAAVAGGDGAHTLEFWSVDNAGNIETTRSVSFTVEAPDMAAPSTTSDAATSYTTTATIHLTAIDSGGSGVAVTYYKIDGGAQTPGTTVSVSSNGAHTLEFWSVDNAGNTEMPHHNVAFTVAIPDTVAPTTSSDAVTTYTPSATIHLSATDAGGSGVRATYYRIDSGAQTTGTVVSTSAAGSHSLEFWSVDNAGNAESPHHTLAFTVLAPATGTFRFDFHNTAYDEDWTIGGYSVWYRVTDSGGRVVKSGWAYSSAPDVSVPAGGPYDVTADLYTMAGGTPSFSWPGRTVAPGAVVTLTGDFYDPY